MGASKALAEWAVEAADARYPDTTFSRRALRQRARVLGLRRADLPAPDRGRRTGHGHRPRDDALLHDDPGGRPARDPRRARWPGRRAVRARDGRAGLDHGAGEPDDPLLGPGAGAATSRSRSSARARARSCTSSSSTPTSAPSRRPRRRSCGRRGRRVDPAWVEHVFDKVGVLVAEGDAAGLASACGGATRGASDGGWASASSGTLGPRPAS